MINFVLLYTGGTAPEGEENIAKVMDAWNGWYTKVGDKVVDGGNPFGGSKHITVEGVHDGPHSAAAATGYTIIQAESMDEAVALVTDHPHVKWGGEVTIQETFKM